MTTRRKQILLKGLLLGGMVLLLSGCFGPALRPVDTSMKPISRPLYSVAPPTDRGWQYLEGDLPDDGHMIVFAKRNSPTHSIIFNIEESKAGPRPDTPQKFFQMIEAEMKKTYESQRYTHQTVTCAPADLFGPYSVRARFRAEDHAPANLGDNPYLILEGTAYHFFHPSEPFVLMTVTYSERGKAEEVSKSLEHDADTMIKHVILSE